MNAKFLWGFLALLSLTSAEKQLEFVQLVIRHGDRTPLKPFPAHKSDGVVWDCTLQEYYSTTYPGDEDPFSRPMFLKTVVDTEGKVRPDITGNCTFGQLTDKGRKMHNELGRYLQDRYMFEYKFLNHRFDPDEVYLRSTDIQRTIQSLEALMDTFFSTEYQDGNEILVVETREQHTETMYPNSVLCPRLTQLQKDVYKTTYWRDHISEPIPSRVIESISEIFDQDPKTLSGARLISINDGIICLRSHNKPLPQGFTKENHLADELEREAFWEHLTVQNYTHELLSLNIGMFIKQLLTQMMDKVNGLNHRKMEIYSGHDTTIAPLTQVMGINDGYSFPPYASHLLFELWNDKEIGQRYVRVIYNKRVQQLGGKCESSFCKLEDFVALMGSYIPSDFDKSCGIA